MAVEPEKYTNQAGYVSDTEASEIIGSSGEEENNLVDGFEESEILMKWVNNVKDEF